MGTFAKIIGGIGPDKIAFNMYKTIFILALVRTGLAQTAECIFTGDGNGEVSGEVALSSSSDGTETEIMGEVVGLSPGLHGFHIHANGDLGDNCKAAGGHFNPAGLNHGAPGDEVRHIGDLGNIDVREDGLCMIKINDNLALLSGDNSILGKAIVIHEGTDDLGKGGDEGSITTGNAGA